MRTDITYDAGRTFRERIIEEEETVMDRIGRHMDQAGRYRRDPFLSDLMEEEQERWGRRRRMLEEAPDGQDGEDLPGE